jgi:hypothetical protein
MSDPIPLDSARAYITLLEWHIDAIRFHLDQLVVHCKPYLTDGPVGMSPYDAALGHEFSETIHALGDRTIALLLNVGR